MLRANVTARLLGLHSSRAVGAFHGVPAMRGGTVSAMATFSSYARASHALSVSVRHSSSTASSTPKEGVPAKDASKPEEQKVEKPPIGKFAKYAREHGIFFAVYFLTVCELFAWVLTYLVHMGYVAGGDCASLVAMMGATKYIDVDGWADASINVLGLFDLTGRLALNYFVCSSIAPVAYPALLPLCLWTTPGLKRIVFFWRKPAIAAAKAS